MKPIKLIMSAFGSYARKTEIDFKAADHGIFLITGDTGSGKTTIFDAIVYALYDRTSADARTPGDMRSQYADFETPTYVEFTFGYDRGGRSEVYTVRRNPTYTRRSKRKDKDGNYKETSERPSVELILPDKSVYNGRINEINEKIIEIAGLDYNQYTQTVMLAQGEFMRLLRASSNERREIFGRIFDTKIYRLIQDRLRNASKERYIALEDNRKLCENELSAIKSGSGDIFSFTDSDYETLLSSIDALIKKGKCDEAQKRDELKSVRKKLDRLNVDRSLGERINSIYDSLNEAVENRQRLEEKKADIDALAYRTEKALKAQKITPIVQKRSEQQTMADENKIRIKDHEEKLALISENIRALEEKKALAYEERNRNEPRLRELLSKLEDELPLYEKAEVLSGEIDRIRSELEDVVKKGKEQQTAVQDKQQELAALHQAAKDAAEMYERSNDAFIAEQAGIMAASLKEGMPCPVCGATVHPDKACLSESAVSQSQVNSAKLARRDAEKKEADAVEELARLKDILERCSEEQAQKNKALEIADIRYRELRERLTFDTPKAVRRQIKSTQEELDKLSKAVQDAELNWQSEKEKMTEMSGMCASEREQQKRLEKDMEILEEKLRLTVKEQGFDSIAAYMEYVIDDKQLDDMQRTIREYNEECVRNSEVTAQLEKQIDALRESEGQKASRINLEQVTDSIRQLAETAADVEKEVNRLYADNHINEEIYKKVSRLYEKRTVLKHEYELYSTLDKTANGNLPGSVKLDFQTYIQRRYFDAIVNEANKRLIKMSRGQFILQCRSLDRLGSQGAVGLDLDVYSLVNDKTRDVKTLSGGESFMAALSMALGMSDIIQNTAGRVQLDTMFVDEGFGSLDDDARNEAVKILQELAGDTRLVGIISHVAELKEQIDRKLVVKKDERGSSVEWIS